jgi:tRNA-splicing ligase RtcB
MPNLYKLASLIPYEQLKMEQALASEEDSDSGLSQVHDALDLDFLIKLALMPDYHKGYLLPIGGVALLDGVISPNYVGYDIGCGMCCVITDLEFQDVFQNMENGRRIYNEIIKAIPVGMTWHESGIDYDKFKSAGGFKDLDKMIETRINTQLGTLGGGNHFIEIGFNKKGKLGVTIHSGSRKSGWWVGQHYMALAKNEEKQFPNGFLDSRGDLGIAYWEDMEFFLKYALENRKIMMERILEVLGFTSKDIKKMLSTGMINENHNHAVFYGSKILHRKGATPAYKGVKGVIPGNILAGTYITEGLGNEEYLCSASHGAGRRNSRKAAKKRFAEEKGLVEETRKQMSEIICPRLNKIRDELPFAYKDVESVIALQEGIVIKTLDHITPRIVVKGEEEKRWKQRKSRKNKAS